MERLLDENERIRRAEEIYYRRNQQSAPEMGKSSRQNLLSNKLMFNLLLMINIAILIFCIQNKNYVFSTEFLNMLSEYNNVLTSKFMQFISLDEDEEKCTFNLENDKYVAPDSLCDCDTM